MEAVPLIVREYLESFVVPAGHSLDELLGLVDELANGGAWPTIGAMHEGVALHDDAGRSLRADVIVPPGESGPFPVLVYLHGGGWRFGSSQACRRLMYEFAAAGLLVIAVNYRRGPRHRFPAPIDDCDRAIEWAQSHAPDYGGDGRAVAVGGDSAGAHLAAATLVRRSLGGALGVAAAVLLYGIYDYHRGSVLLGPTIADGTADGQSFLEPAHFESLRGDLVVSPLYAASHLPPCYLACGADDPLLGESVELAQRLEEGGVEHELDVVERAPHAFFQLQAIAGRSKAFERAVAFLRRQLRTDLGSD